YNQPLLLRAIGDGCTMIQPERAAVRPRIFALNSGAALPLDEEILRVLALPSAVLGSFAARAQNHEEILRVLEVPSPGLVRIIGPSGSGKPTALRHLAAVLPPDAPVTLLDEPCFDEVLKALHQGLVVYTASSSRPVLADGLDRVSLRLAPWTDD